MMFCRGVMRGKIIMLNAGHALELGGADIIETVGDEMLATAAALPLRREHMGFSTLHYAAAA